MASQGNGNRCGAVRLWFAALLTVPQGRGGSAWGAGTAGKRAPPRRRACRICVPPILFLTEFLTDRRIRPLWKYSTRPRPYWSRDQVSAMATAMR